MERRYETVTAARDGLDEPWIFSRVPERLPQLCNRSIQAALELDKRVFRPERGTKSLARHHLAGAREQQTKNTVGLVLQLDPNAALPQFRSLSIQFEAAETIFRAGGGRLSHNEVSLTPITTPREDCCLEITSEDKPLAFRELADDVYLFA
jgi:hypothetical protein